MKLAPVAIQYCILHNRKTGGTALKEVIDLQKQRTPQINVTCFGHAMTLPQLVKDHPNAKAIFFIRHPVSRFVSGFYSGLRQGQPRYHFPWSSAEAKAFARFTTANQLAEALSDSSLFERRAATAAMKSIRHVRHTYLDFLGSPAFIEDYVERIAFIGHQAEFDADLIKLRLILNIDDDIEAPSDDIRAHRNPSDINTHLSKRAITNLENWYHKDIEIYHYCLEIRKRILLTLDQSLLYQNIDQSQVC